MKRKSILIAVLACTLLASGCTRSGAPERGEGQNSGVTTPVSGDFGDLRSVCRPGTATGSPAQGVTAQEIKLGVFTDMGFSKNSEFPDAAKVFTSWCNAAGGVNGRKLIADIHDTNLMEVRQRMLDACRDDFALVGGGAGLDGLGVKDRLSCLLPDFPAQGTMPSSVGSDLQVGVGASGAAPYNPYTGYFDWLTKQKYPDSADSIGIITGDSQISKPLADKYTESLTANGAKVVYSELYPAAGVPDWTPYAQSLKTKGVKGLIFIGEFRSLAKLEDVLTSMDYKLDWIDANSNSYNSSFLKLAASSLSAQNNYVDLSGTAPVEAADQVPAVKELKQLFAKYAPGKDLTFPVLRAFQAWLLFAKAADSCGDQLTRRCVYDAAAKESTWTGGGLLAPTDVAPNGRKSTCFNVVEATSDGWKPADFAPDTGLYRCDMIPYEYHADYGHPMTLADVGKSMNDLQ